MLKVCTQCGGIGKVTPPGQSEIICDACRGSGQMETDWIATISEIRGLVDTLESTIDAHTIEIAAIKVMCEKIDNIKNKCDHIKDKCDQIWDKVKDL